MNASQCHCLVQIWISQGSSFYLILSMPKKKRYSICLWYALRSIRHLMMISSLTSFVAAYCCSLCLLSAIACGCWYSALDRSCQTACSTLWVWVLLRDKKCRYKEPSRRASTVCFSCTRKDLIVPQPWLRPSKLETRPTNGTSSIL